MKHNLFKKLFSSALIACFGLFMLSSLQADEVEIPSLRNLLSDAQISEQQQLPIVVLFSASYCGFCSIVKEEFLRPMLISGDYTHKALIRVIEIDGSDDVMDLTGKAISAEDFADQHNISLTPTLAFFDSEGNELAPRMVGVTTVDFFGGYLDEAIDASLLRLKSERQLASKTLP